MFNKLYIWSLLFSILISQSQTVSQHKKFVETVNGFKFEIEIPDEETSPNPDIPNEQSHPNSEVGSTYIVEEGNQSKKNSQNNVQDKTKRQAINKSKDIPTYNNDVEFYNYDIDWNLTPEKMMSNAKEILVKCKKFIADIIAVPKEERSFENTFQAFAEFEAYYQTVQPLTFLSKVSPDPKIRQASKNASSILGKFSIKLGTDVALYAAFKEFQDIAKSNGAYEKLDPESQRYLDRVVKDMENQGVNLAVEKRLQVDQLNIEISTLSKEALSNIATDGSMFEISEKDLENLGKSAVEQLEKVPGKEGYRKFLLKSPTTSSILRLCENNEVKMKLTQAKDSQAKEKNIPILEKLVQKRNELAIMLNYTSFSSYSIDGLMAKTPETVQKFHDDLRMKITERAKQEIQAINQIKSENMTEELTNVQQKDWDFTYFYNEFSLRQDDVDSKKISEYFLMENVKLQTMSIYETLLGLTFSKIPDHKAWAKDVTYYEVRDTQSMNVLGHFYLDLYPRKNKFNHAAVFQLIKKAKIDIKVRNPTVAMVTNFKKSQKGKPSLLPHHDMITFFHEFGHIMHSMCTESNYNRFSGTSVERDFVEMPSQMMENWIHDKEILKKVTKHYKTGKPMPDKYIDSIILKKNTNNAITALSSIFQGTLDLLLYSARDSKLLKQPQKLAQNGFEDSNSLRKHIKMKSEFVPDIEDLYHTLSEKIALQKMLPGTNPAAHFGHIISGYESQYYSYLWSQVYSCDIFQHFQQAGLLNQEMGMKYRKTILAPGGSRDSIELITEFLGREPTIDAYLEMNNFTEKQLKKKVDQVPLYHNQKVLDKMKQKAKK